MLWSQLMDFQREIKSLTRLPWVRKYHQALFLLMTSEQLLDSPHYLQRVEAESRGRSCSGAEKLPGSRDLPSSLEPLLSELALMDGLQWGIALAFPHWMGQHNGFQGNCLTFLRFPFFSTCLHSDPKKRVWFPNLPPQHPLKPMIPSGISSSCLAWGSSLISWQAHFTAHAW